jgi:hypothetical protein
MAFQPTSDHWRRPDPRRQDLYRLPGALTCKINLIRPDQGQAEISACISPWCSEPIGPREIDRAEIR